MITLCDFGNPVCCQRVRITLRAKSLQWDVIAAVRDCANSAGRNAA